MEFFNAMKVELGRASSRLKTQLQASRSIPGMMDQRLERWEKTCETIESQIAEEILRVAVVGPIKSGKSTFVNSLFHGDYLKRGAGVVTSIVTRIRKGKELKATLQFKAWEDVNADIEQALVMLPHPHEPSPNEAFDIRKKKDRSLLSETLYSLPAEMKITKSTRNVNSVLLSSYFNGFDRIKAIEFPESMVVEYRDEKFPEHRFFTGDEVLAVYLKDIELTIQSDSRLEDIEIADCQGSDSPNPLHIAMIQDYLMGAHMLIYVISSRTGLRQADIRFLSMIKKMGIMDNILFVINCDFSEHENLENLEQLIRKVEEELSLLKQTPRIFAFSSLFNLFLRDPRTLTEKDRKRFEQWQGEEAFVRFSDLETSRFEDTFHQLLTVERLPLLMKNHLERLKRIAAGVTHRTDINRDLLSGDQKRARDIVQRIEAHQRKMNQISKTIRKTLDGGVQQMKGEIRKEIDKFFDPRYGEVAGDLRGFIRSYKADLKSYSESVDAVGFNQTLFMVYQEFKQALDSFMAETSNPKIIGFLKEMENNISDALQSLIAPYEAMAKEAWQEYTAAMEPFDIKAPESNADGIKSLSLDAIKKSAGLRVPTAMAIMRYSARVKTEAVMRFGLYSILKVIKKALKKPTGDKHEDALLALKDGIRRMKRETESSILFHLKNHKENLKFQYLFKLNDEIADFQYEALMEQYQAYSTDLTKLTSSMDEKRIDKQQVYALLEGVKTAIEQILGEISQIESRLAETSP